MAAKAPTSETNTANQDVAEGEARKEARIVKLMSVNGIRRAGIRFPAGQEVPVNLDELTEDQMKALEREKELRPV
jgi:hypothetical protein